MGRGLSEFHRGQRDVERLAKDVDLKTVFIIVRLTADGKQKSFNQGHGKGILFLDILCCVFYTKSWAVHSFLERKPCRSTQRLERHYGENRSSAHAAKTRGCP